MKISKWIGLGGGWILGGPIGAIVGFAVGAILDSTVVVSKPGAQTTRTDFAVSFLVLVAAVMKADGKVVRSELDFVREYLLRAFGPTDSQQMILLLRDILNQNIKVEEVCWQIRDNLDYESRLELLHLLYGIAKADGVMDATEIRLIEHIAVNMGISSGDSNSIKATFFDDMNSAYKVLEIEPSATDDEVKKAYRTMAVKYHPDKVSYLGEDVQASAKEKFQKLNEAYEKIKKERGLN